MTIVIRMVFALLGALGAIQIASHTEFPDSYHPSSSRYLVWASVVLGGAAAGWLIAALVDSAVRPSPPQGRDRSFQSFGLRARRRRHRPPARPRRGGLLAFAVVTAAVRRAVRAAAAVPGARLRVRDRRRAPRRAILRLVGINPARFESPSGERSTERDVEARRHLGDHRRPHLRHRRDRLPRRRARDPGVRARGAAAGRRLERSRSAGRAAGAGSRWCTTSGSRSGRCRRPTSTIPTSTTSTRSSCSWRRSGGLPILTTDYNLNKVARIQGVTVLNVNELANALKPAVLPGESLRVKVIREGKEADQGVGYLNDGTMIVIECGPEAARRHRRRRGDERAAEPVAAR